MIVGGVSTILYNFCIKCVSYVNRSVIDMLSAKMNAFHIYVLGIYI
jgi:hypothetical protein